MFQVVHKDAFCGLRGNRGKLRNVRFYEMDKRNTVMQDRTGRRLLVRNPVTGRGGSNMGTKHGIARQAFNTWNGFLSKITTNLGGVIRGVSAIQRIGFVHLVRPRG